MPRCFICSTKTSIQYKTCSIVVFTKDIGDSIACTTVFNPIIKQKTSITEDPILVVLQDNSASLVSGSDSSFFANEYPELFNNLKDRLLEDYNVDIYLIGESLTEGDSINFEENYTDIDYAFEGYDVFIRKKMSEPYYYCLMAFTIEE